MILILGKPGERISTVYFVMVVNNDSCWSEDRLIHDRRLVSTTFLWVNVVTDVKMGVCCDGCDDGGRMCWVNF